MKLVALAALVLSCLLASVSAFVRMPTPAAPRSSSSSVRPLAAEGPNFFEWGSRFLNELLPWGDSSKGLWAGKRDAMVQKYMEKTGCSLEEAQREVDDYLQDKTAYVIKKRAEEDAAKKGK